MTTDDYFATGRLNGVNELHYHAGRLSDQPGLGTTWILARGAAQGPGSSAREWVWVWAVGR